MSLLCTLNDGVACSVGGAGSVYVCVHVLKPATRLPNAGSVCPAHELCKLISLSKTKSMYAMCAGSRLKHSFGDVSQSTWRTSLRVSSMRTELENSILRPPAN